MLSAKNDTVGPNLSMFVVDAPEDLRIPLLNALMEAFTLGCEIKRFERFLAIVYPSNGPLSGASYPIPYLTTDLLAHLWSEVRRNAGGART